ncbi:hypothetical protein CALCODRAFT_499496 [Calocera cornea HHB12733]|uniref:C2H2-type domain-containing protein n=1 Tax=Calocera cornea HHB12733 TaxID=1353952 RepID=A0A165EEC2_9BASI|nr:hypothetical protein CALCODRAFT_499496 [Calocera cornea HHB12733]
MSKPPNQPPPIPIHLPAVLHSRPAQTDASVNAGATANILGKVATPQDTPIWICTLHDCNRIFPSHERLGMHRKRDHHTDDVDSAITTWNS